MEGNVERSVVLDRIKSMLVKAQTPRENYVDRVEAMEEYINGELMQKLGIPEDQRPVLLFTSAKGKGTRGDVLVLARTGANSYKGVQIGELKNPDASLVSYKDYKAFPVLQTIRRRVLPKVGNTQHLNRWLDVYKELASKIAKQLPPYVKNLNFAQPVVKKLEEDEKTKSERKTQKQKQVAYINDIQRAYCTQIGAYTVNADETIDYSFSPESELFARNAIKEMGLKYPIKDIEEATPEMNSKQFEKVYNEAVKDGKIKPTMTKLQYAQHLKWAKETPVKDYEVKSLRRLIRELGGMNNISAKEMLAKYWYVKDTPIDPDTGEPSLDKMDFNADVFIVEPMVFMTNLDKEGSGAKHSIEQQAEYVKSGRHAPKYLGTYSDDSGKTQYLMNRQLGTVTGDMYHVHDTLDEEGKIVSLGWHPVKYFHPKGEGLKEDEMTYEQQEDSDEKARFKKKVKEIAQERKGMGIIDNLDNDTQLWADKLGLKLVEDVRTTYTRDADLLREQYKKDRYEITNRITSLEKEIGENNESLSKLSSADIDFTKKVDLLEKLGTDLQRRQDYLAMEQKNLKDADNSFKEESTNLAEDHENAINSGQRHVTYHPVQGVWNNQVIDDASAIFKNKSGTDILFYRIHNFQPQVLTPWMSDWENISNKTSWQTTCRIALERHLKEKNKLPQDYLTYEQLEYMLNMSKAADAFNERTTKADWALDDDTKERLDEAFPSLGVLEESPEGEKKVKGKKHTKTIEELKESSRSELEKELKSINVNIEADRENLKNELRDTLLEYFSKDPNGNETTIGEYAALRAKKASQDGELSPVDADRYRTLKLQANVWLNRMFRQPVVQEDGTKKTYVSNYVDTRLKELHYRRDVVKYALGLIPTEPEEYQRIVAEKDRVIKQVNIKQPTDFSNPVKVLMEYHKNFQDALHSNANRTPESDKKTQEYFDSFVREVFKSNWGKEGIRLVDAYIDNGNALPISAEGDAIYEQNFLRPAQEAWAMLPGNAMRIQRIAEDKEQLKYVMDGDPVKNQIIKNIKDYNEKRQAVSDKAYEEFCKATDYAHFLPESFEGKMPKTAAYSSVFISQRNIEDNKYMSDADYEIKKRDQIYQAIQDSPNYQKLMALKKEYTRLSNQIATFEPKVYRQLRGSAETTVRGIQLDDQLKQLKEEKKKEPKGSFRYKELVSEIDKVRADIEEEANEAASEAAGITDEAKEYGMYDPIRRERLSAEERQLSDQRIAEITTRLKNIQYQSQNVYNDFVKDLGTTYAHFGEDNIIPYTKPNGKQGLLKFEQAEDGQILITPASRKEYVLPQDLVTKAPHPFEAVDIVVNKIGYKSQGNMGFSLEGNQYPLPLFNIDNLKADDISQEWNGADPRLVSVMANYPSYLKLVKDLKKNEEDPDSKISRETLDYMRSSVDRFEGWVKDLGLEPSTNKDAILNQIAPKGFKTTDEAMNYFMEINTYPYMLFSADTPKIIKALKEGNREVLPKNFLSDEYYHYFRHFVDDTERAGAHQFKFEDLPDYIKNDKITDPTGTRSVEGQFNNPALTPAQKLLSFQNLAQKEEEIEIDPYSPLVKVTHADKWDREAYQELLDTGIIIPDKESPEQSKLNALMRQQKGIHDQWSDAMINLKELERNKIDLQTQKEELTKKRDSLLVRYEQPTLPEEGSVKLNESLRQTYKGLRRIDASLAKIDEHTAQKLKETKELFGQVKKIEADIDLSRYLIPPTYQEEVPQQPVARNEYQGSKEHLDFIGNKIASEEQRQKELAYQHNSMRNLYPEEEWMFHPEISQTANKIEESKNEVKRLKDTAYSYNVAPDTLQQSVDNAYRQYIQDKKLKETEDRIAQAKAKGNVDDYGAAPEEKKPEADLSSMFGMAKKPEEEKPVEEKPLQGSFDDIAAKFGMTKTAPKVEEEPKKAPKKEEKKKDLNLPQEKEEGEEDMPEGAPEEEETTPSREFTADEEETPSPSKLAGVGKSGAGEALEDETFDIDTAEQAATKLDKPHAKKKAKKKKKITPAEIKRETSPEAMADLRRRVEAATGTTPTPPAMPQEVEEPNIDIKSMRKFMKPDTSFFETTGKPMSTAGLLHRISKMVEK